MTEPTWLPAPDGAATANALAEEFARRFGSAPQGVWSAPGRVNLIGEHTDYNDGLCLPIALPHRTYAAIGVRADDVIRIEGLQTEQVWSGRLDEVGPGRPEGWVGYPLGVLWSLQRRGARIPGLDILIDGRVPTGSGLSSSAALECSVAVALADLAETRPTRDDLVAAAIEAENVVVGAATGGLDQTASVYAQAGHALLLDLGEGGRTQIPWRIGEEGWQVLVVDTRAPHALADGQYAARRETCEQAVAILGIGSLREVDPSGLDATLARLPDELTRRRVRHVVTEIERTRVAAEDLGAGRLESFGAAWWASHGSLRDDYEVSAPGLDLVVEVARAQGAAGARMTGGGFGGSAIVLLRSGTEDAMAAAVDHAFAEREWNAPQFLLATPAGPASRDL